MDPAAVAREYVVFALVCGRVLPGLVDRYFGPAELSRRAADQSPPTPAALVAQARWLRIELVRSGMAEPRRDFLDRQLRALQCGLRRLAGGAVGYRDEVRAYFDTDIRVGTEEHYHAAHAELAALLPGRGPLAARLAAYQETTRVAPELLAPAVQRLAAALRGPARTHLGLPPEEAVFFELVRDRPWSAFHHYLGGYRSRVAVNTDTRVGVLQLARLVAHEVYPGHHAERVRAEHALRSRDATPERAVFPLNTPYCLVSEGMADLGLEVLVGEDRGGWVRTVLDGLVDGSRSGGADQCGELAERVEAALLALAPVRQDAALMVHERAASEAEALAHLCRWLLVSESRARQMLRFITHPLWRAYTTTYVEGQPLVRGWLDAAPPGESMPVRYLDLLDAPRSPSALRAELANRPDPA